MAAPGPPIKAEESELTLGESALYVQSGGGGLKGYKGHRRHSEECDWGNTKEREGVCWRCGRKHHIVKHCIADMPEDIKWKVLDHAHVADIDPEAMLSKLFAFVSDTYGSGKHGKLKPGRPRKWIGEKGTGEFSW